VDKRKTKRESAKATLAKGHQRERQKSQVASELARLVLPTMTL
jgi:hypothetical protein